MLLRLIYMKRVPVHEGERVGVGRELGVEHQEMIQAPEVYVHRLMRRRSPLLPLVPIWQILQ
jgi:hypothetical protein